MRTSSGPLLIASLLAALLQACTTQQPRVIEEKPAPIQEPAASVPAAPVESVIPAMENPALDVKITKAMDSDPEIREKAHVNVTVFGELVLLTGEAATPALHARIIRLADEAAEEHRIRSELAIADPTPPPSRSKDTLITSRVKSALLADKGLKGLHIKVVTENGVVYLLGNITRDEAATAVKLVRQIQDVQRVVKVFEYKE